MKFDRQKLFHESFRIAILLKGIDGALEVLGGTAVWLLSPSLAQSVVRRLFRHELAEDPRDFLATHLLWATRHLAAGRWFAVAFLLTHGAAKLILVISLWFNRLWAYPLMIAVLVAFIAYQTAQFTQTHSTILALLTLFDLAILALTGWEYREQLRIRSSRS
jgi:uncharacterized membrane protein